MKKINNQRFFIIFIILLTFIVRLYRINYPIGDWHSWRQTDTASVTREYVKHGINLLEPHYQDISNLQSGLDNTEGWRMVEFPFINALIAFVLLYLPNPGLIVTSRLVSIIFSIGTNVALYFLVKKISNKRIAQLSTLAFALLPFSIFYGRAVLPESGILFFSTSSILFFKQYLDENKLQIKIAHYFTSLILLALALLLKPFVAFLGPVYVVLAVLKYQKNIYKHLELLLFGVLAFIPFLAWREWIKQFPSGIPASSWLFNSNGIRLRPAWFRWLFYERLTRLILGFWGLILVTFNLHQLNKKWSEVLIYGSWGLGLLAYLIIIATGNVQHDYYQVLTLPFVSILVGRGAWFFYQFWRKKLGGNNSQLATIALFVLMLVTSWSNVKGYFNVNHWDYVRAGAVVDQLTPADAKIIAPAFGDTIFLFQTNRTGWPIGFNIDDKINRGATYYVTTTYDDEAHELEAKYVTIVKTDEYLLLDLTKPLESK